jgi:hypothetical protein
MKLRNWNPLPRFEDEQDDYDTRPLDTEPITPLDEQIDDLIRFGERLDAVDTEGNDDEQL